MGEGWASAIVLEKAGVVLITPNHELGDGTEDLATAVVMRHHAGINRTKLHTCVPIRPQLHTSNSLACTSVTNSLLDSVTTAFLVNCV
jgi:hypothetical protein